MKELMISSSPHFHSKNSTQRIMIDVCIAMMPTTIWGIAVFGFRAFAVVILSVLSAVLTEYLLNLISKENTIWDFSAVITGLLVGLNMAPNVPLMIPCLASIFAIAVAKWTFGGLGSNWANPAIAGRLFVFFSFSSAMSEFKTPSTIMKSQSAASLMGLSKAKFDAVSSATPLSLCKSAVNSGTFKGLSTLEILSSENYLYSDFAQKISNSTGWNVYNIDAFLGNVSGCIGEVSSMMILIGAAYLLIRGVIDWIIPAFYILSFAFLTWIFGGTVNGMGLFSGEVLSALLRGGLLLAAFFMATDMVTTPVTRKGMAVYAVGCGFFTFLFRFFGSLPEGASLAILLMNIATPTIDKFCKPVKFGSVKGAKK